jgi:hypothetical protein
MIRADCERRRALAVVASLGVGTGPAAERFRMVIYLIGDPDEQAPERERCHAYAKAQGWEVVAVRTDRDPSQWAWLRTGLLSAVTIICHGNADAVLMPQSVADMLSEDDRSFLLNRLHRFGGFLRTISADDMARIGDAA